MTTPSRADSRGSATADRVVRHALPDRAVSLGLCRVRSDSARHGLLADRRRRVRLGRRALDDGVVLAAAVLFHVVRVLVRGTFRSMWIGRADVADALDVVGATLRRGFRRAGPASTPWHRSSFTTRSGRRADDVVTGGFMLLRIDTPWWQRNPYLFADADWAIVYVLHGLAALCSSRW